MNNTDTKPLALHFNPVGKVQSPIKTPILKAGESDIELQKRMDQMRDHHQEIKDTVSSLFIFEPWTELLDGIEGFSHILVLYWPHLIDPERRNLRKVHPMGRKDLPMQGIFATRSPARPNPVLVSTVPLLKREGNVLTVKELEAVDGSPLIDIKPYMRAYHDVAQARVPDWVRLIENEIHMEGK